MDPTKYIWLDGELVEWDAAQTHVLSHALHYGTGVFEGIRAYDNAEGTAVFRLREHMERLEQSAGAYSIPLKYSVDEMVAAAKETVAANELDSAYIRPIVFYGAGTIGLNPSGAELVTSIVAFPWGAYHGEASDSGVKVKISKWKRISPESFPPAKATGPYINSVIANQEAVAAGYHEALLLTLDGAVSEGSGENIFLVRNGEIVTPPLSDGCLNGITRQSVITLLTDVGHEIVEKSIYPDDLFAADELFFTGTAVEVTPIRQVDEQEIGEPGPITRQAQQLFHDAKDGKLAQYGDWLDYI